MMRVGLVIATCLAGAVLAASAALAQAPIPTPPGPQNPWPAPPSGGKFDIFFYVETLTASPGESIYGGAAPTVCTQTNFFARRERAVWHIGAVNARTGKYVLPKDVKYAYLKIPGVKNIGVTFVPHGRDPATAPWTWTARWDIPPDYPLGVVPFVLVMKLKAWPKNKVATFTQMPLALEQMTIIDRR